MEFFLVLLVIFSIIILWFWWGSSRRNKELTTLLAKAQGELHLERTKPISMYGICLMHGKYKDYAANFIIAVGQGIYAPHEPEMRVLIPIHKIPSGKKDYLGSPEWEELETRDKNGRRQILMLGALYTVPEQESLFDQTGQC